MMSDKEQTILDAAATLFHRHGYRKVSVSDIAIAAGMSRPSLYAAFDNKEAVLAALVASHGERNRAATVRQLPTRRSLHDQLACIFDIWIIQPFAAVADSENAIELLDNVTEYAPDAMAAFYAQFERHLVGVLKPQIGPKRVMKAGDLAHIMMLATKGLKASTATVADLRRMTNGLIAMAVATTAAGK